MPAPQVLALIQNAGDLKIRGKDLRGCSGSTKWGTDLEWWCESFASDHGIEILNQDTELRRTLQSMTNAQMLPSMVALLRGCTLYAPADSGHGGATCILLGRVFLLIGNKEAAATVWEFAPGCAAYWHGSQRDVCFAQAYHYISDKAALQRIARKTCDTLHDRNACEYIASLGEKVDMNAVTQAEADRIEARQEYKEEVAEKVAKQEAEANRPSTLLTALQSMPGANDPNAIVNAGDRQAAAIRAIGDANGAQQTAAQQVGAQQQAAAQQAQQATQVNRASAAAPTSTSSSDTESASLTANVTHYAAALPSNCIGQFWDPKYYNWLSFQNNCGQAVHLSWIAANPSDRLGFSSAILALGGAVNSGWSQDEVQRKGGFLFEVCPAGYLPVDAMTDQPVSRANQEFRCKQQ